MTVKYCRMLWQPGLCQRTMQRGTLGNYSVFLLAHVGTLVRCITAAHNETLWNLALSRCSCLLCSVADHPAAKRIAPHSDKQYAAKLNPGNFGGFGELGALLAMLTSWMSSCWHVSTCWRISVFFPTCQVRVVRFYQSCSPPPPRLAVLLLL